MTARRITGYIAMSCLLLTLSVVSSSAQQFTLGASGQNVTFTGTGTNFLDLTMGTGGGSCPAGSICLSGTGLTPDGEAGTYSLVTTGGPPRFGPNNGLGVFPLSNVNGVMTVFNFTDTTDGDSNASVAITYVDIANGSGSPRVEFTTPLSGAVDEITIAPLTCSVTPCNIDTVALNAGATATGPVSSGQVVVPEPASMALLGTALFGAYGLLRRRTRSS